MNEILEIIAEEWDRDPARVLAAVAAIPFRDRVGARNAARRAALDDAPSAPTVPVEDAEYVEVAPEPTPEPEAAPAAPDVEEAVVREDPGPCDSPSPYGDTSERCAQPKGHDGHHRNAVWT